MAQMGLQWLKSLRVYLQILYFQKNTLHGAMNKRLNSESSLKSMELKGNAS